MNKTVMIETFNTHRMSDSAIYSLTTARDAEFSTIIKLVRRAINEPNATPQHIVVYGERGAGKSFLLRMIEIEIQKIQTVENLPVLAVLLPEEHYNIRNASQLIEAITSKVRGQNWTHNGFSFDTRTQADAWEAATMNLASAIDQKFGVGIGLVVAMVENFDGLTKSFFGNEASSEKHRASNRAIEQAAAEQLLRRLLNTRGSRMMLIGAATGTIDQDYERPLFQAFKSVDLKAWDSDDCITYFNRRHILEGKPALTQSEKARIRAVASFIGGNPRLVQLLGNALDTHDARSIASVLDSLSDHLADYYRRRLDDLSPQSAALLDSLIRGGEPCTQSALASRVGATSQAQVADAFSRLLQARLLSAEQKRGEAGILYRVRDRLFVHFYRRRYGGADQTDGLAPIAELLEKFFTISERESIARKHLEAGEWTEADVLAPPFENINSGSCPYLRRTHFQGIELLVSASGVPAILLKEIYDELINYPRKAVMRWGKISRESPSLVKKSAALTIEALALARAGLDRECVALLKQTIKDAESASDADALIICLSELSKHAGARQRDRTLEKELRKKVGLLAPDARTPETKLIALMALVMPSLATRSAIEEKDLLDEAAAIAKTILLPRSEALINLAISQNFVRRGDYTSALNYAEGAFYIANKLKLYDLEIRSLLSKARTFRKLNQPTEAVRDATLAANIATNIEAYSDIAQAETIKGFVQFRIGQEDLSENSFKRALAAAISSKNRILESMALRVLAIHSRVAKKYENAAKYSYQSLKIAVRSESYIETFNARKELIMASAFVVIENIVEELNQFLSDAQQNKVLLDEFNQFIPQALAGIAKSNAWRNLLEDKDGILSYIERSEGLHPFSLIGHIWADQAALLGRAKFFGDFSNVLPDVAQLMKRLPTPGSNEQRTQRGANLDDALLGFVANCRQPLVMTDIAQLLPQHFGDDANPWPERLHAFSNVLNAKDKLQVVQELDPELATLVRTMLQLPKAEDSLLKKGRKKGR